MNIIIFEDCNTNNLKPFSINHAAFELKSGYYSNLERIVYSFTDIDDINFILIVRNELKDIIQEKFPRYIVNPSKIPSGLYLNGAALWNQKLIDKVFQGYAFSSSGNLVAFKSNDSVLFEDIHQLLDKTSGVTSDLEINYISYLWDCIDLISEMLDSDTKSQLSEFFHDEAFKNQFIVINEENIYSDKSVSIEPGCILDARKGPIILGKHVLIQSGSIIKGPIFIDDYSIISSGSKLNGNIIIGPKCKIGGEVQNTIFHGYSNKVHDGFLGDSYIGEWVNLGANTNNSNLKNNYSRIKFSFSDQTIDTNKLFLGAMIGDFTRTGISTMINTGSYIGLGTNLFGSNFQKKYISSFSWGKDNIVEFSKFIDTIKIMKKRRNQSISDIEIALLKNIYNQIKK
tara:strand:- start:2008 stop:3204 length:1197 start_codon:yes stop_codon:yes gene_type:complete